MTKNLLYELYKDIFIHSQFEDYFKGENAILSNFHFNHPKSTYLKDNFNKKIFFRFSLTWGPRPTPPPIALIEDLQKIQKMKFLGIKLRKKTIGTVPSP